MRGVSVQVRFSESFLSVLKHKASAMNLTLSTFIRSALFSTFDIADKQVASQKATVKRPVTTTKRSTARVAQSKKPKPTTKNRLVF